MIPNPGSSNLLLGRNLVGQSFAGAQHIDRRLILALPRGFLDGAQRFRGRFLSSGFRGGKKTLIIQQCIGQNLAMSFKSYAVQGTEYPPVN